MAVGFGLSFCDAPGSRGAVAACARHGDLPRRQSRLSGVAGLVRGLVCKVVAKAIQSWLRDNNIKTIYIDPGCPWQNGYAESFNGRFRAECLNRELLYTLSESRVVFEDWRRYYNG